MNYQEALKASKTAKPAEQYMILSVGYLRLILPFKDALQLLATLEKAEQTTDWGDMDTIRPIDQEKLSISLLSQEVYRRVKVAQLMGLRYREVEDMEIALKQSEKDQHE